MYLVVATSAMKTIPPFSPVVPVFLGQPFFLSVSAYKTTITLVWMVPSGSVVTGHVVMWERDSSVVCPYEDEGDITIPSPVLSQGYTIIGFQEDSRYSVSVTVFNSVENRTTNVTTVTTDEDSKFMN